MLEAFPGLAAMACLAGSIWILARLIGISLVRTIALLLAIFVVPFLIVTLTYIKPQLAYLSEPMALLVSLLPFVVLLALSLALKRNRMHVK